MTRKWANKSRGLRFYGTGRDVFNKDFHVQDGSWALFHGVRIYGHNSDNAGTDICLSLNKKGAKKLMESLQRFIESSCNAV